MCGEKFRPFATMFESKWITPACAGKRTSACLVPPAPWDHPRMCGEKLGVVIRMIASVGSPPHVRGKGICDRSNRSRYGITPACAGKSFFCPNRILWDKDHPRMCGEKKHIKCYERSQTGSPPHVRGKVVNPQYSSVWSRITPACAGKSALRCTSVRKFQDHPRMCGEKPLFMCTGFPTWGSPPHVRGKGSSLGWSRAFHGITPACAGKRLKRSRSIVPHAAIVPLFPSVCNKPAGSDGSPAGHDAPPFLPIENAVPASPAYNLRSL